MARSIYFMAFLVLAMTLFVANVRCKVRKFAVKMSQELLYVLVTRYVNKSVLKRRTMKMVIVSQS
ncbi:hypothetical protein P3L10_020025 [Capsicum annuum]